MLNRKVWIIKKESLENRHHNLSNNILLDQNEGWQDHKGSSQSWKEMHKYYFSGQKLIFKVSNKMN